MGAEHFDDGGYTGGNMDRPALQRLLAAVGSRSVDCVVVYKVDRRRDRKCDTACTAGPRARIRGH